MFSALVTTIHILVSVFMILVILLQAGKGAGMGSAMGGGGSGTVFGGRGSATFLSKVTSICAVIFFITSFTLSTIASHHPTVMGGKAPVTAPAETPKAPEQGAAPTTPAPTTPAPAQNAPAAPAPSAP